MMLATWEYKNGAQVSVLGFYHCSLGDAVYS